MWLSRILLPAPYYCLCLNEKQFAKALRHIKVPQYEWPDFVMKDRDATAHFFTKDGEVSCIVCIKNSASRSIEEIHGLLVHEAVHIWQELERILGACSRETEAYSIQGISQQLFLAFNQLTSK